MGYGPLVHFKGPSSFWARIIPDYSKFSKISNTLRFLFSNKNLFSSCKLQNACQNTNREESDLGLPGLSQPFWQVASVPNFRISTITQILCLLLSSTDNLCKQFGPRSGLKICQTVLNQKSLTL